MKHLSTTITIIFLGLINNFCYAQKASQTPKLFSLQNSTASSMQMNAARKANEIRREIPITVNFEALYSQVRNNVTQSKSPKSKIENLEIPIFDGRILKVKKTRVFERSPQNYTWVGEVENSPSSQVILTVVNNHLVGSIELAAQNGYPHTLLGLQSNKDRQHSLADIDRAKLPPQHVKKNFDEKDFLPHTSNVPSKTKSSTSLSTTMGGFTTLTNEKTKIDVMALYSSKLYSIYNNVDYFWLQYAIDKANVAYVNSGINTELQLVYTDVEPYDESNGEAYKYKNVWLPASESVAAKRRTYSADIVVLIVSELKDENGPAACGVAQSAIVKNQPYYFLMTSNCLSAAKGTTLAHEMGHLHGARHVVARDNMVIDGLPAFSHGYANQSAKIRDIMSYADDCTECSEQIQFSSSNLVGGYKFGDYDISNATRAHNEFGPQLASYMPSIVQVSYTNHAAQLFRLYNIMWMRAPDLAGLGYWMKQMSDNGETLEGVANKFLNHPSFIKRWNSGGQLNQNEYFAGWLTSLAYQNSPNPNDQKAQILSQLNSGMSRAAVIAFANESQFVKDRFKQTDLGVAYVPYH